MDFSPPPRFLMTQNQNPPKGAGKLVPRENCRKMFLFFDLFALSENCRKISKNNFDIFWALSVGPFGGVLLEVTLGVDREKLS